MLDPVAQMHRNKPLVVTYVDGTPRPKGSLKPQMIRDGSGRLTGRVRMVESSAESSRWRRIMAKAFRDAYGDCEPYGDAVGVSAQFHFDPREYTTKVDGLPRYPTIKQIGDLDKLVRNVFDALTDAGVYVDDRQVVITPDTWKIWGPQSGVVVRVWPMPSW